MDEVLEDDTENDMVRLELMDMAVSVMSQYPSNFRADGITKKQLSDMCDRIQKNRKLLLRFRVRRHHV